MRSHEHSTPAGRLASFLTISNISIRKDVNIIDLILIISCYNNPGGPNQITAKLLKSIPVPRGGLGHCPAKLLDCKSNITSILGEKIGACGESTIHSCLVRGQRIPCADDIVLS